MPTKEHARSSVVSARLPDELLQRLDRYLDWCETQRGATSSRNAAIRDALSLWLDDQEQHAGLSTSKTLHQQFRTAYQSVRHRDEGARIHRVRAALGWPRERFDAVLEELRAEEHVELSRGVPSQMSEQRIRDSYHVYGQVYMTVRWRD
jgi:Arc/MetJ-type ribon-helix-helix transcriptional regulator